MSKLLTLGILQQVQNGQGSNKADVFYDGNFINHWTLYVYVDDEYIDNPSEIEGSYVVFEGSSWGTAHCTIEVWRNDSLVFTTIHHSYFYTGNINFSNGDVITLSINLDDGGGGVG